MNDIRTWQQGEFIDGPQYRHMGGVWQQAQIDREALLVRPSPKGNAVCTANTPHDAAWIARRLNLASKLEQMTYDFATGKSDGSEIVALVNENIR